jgi:hypothetical protein
MSLRVSIRSMSVLAYAQGFTLWHYKAGAAGLTDTIGKGFFDTASDMLAVGDMVLVSARDGGRMLIVTAINTAAGARAVSVSAFS